LHFAQVRTNIVGHPVPAKPGWYSKINDVIRELESLPRPFVDRATVEFLLGVGRRRAQQIMAPCIMHRVGANGLADREMLIAHLNRLASGEAVHYEQRRRLRLAERIELLERERSRSVMVEAPAAVVNQQFENLPVGVSILPGRITVSFASTREALEKLLALAMAVGNDPLLFERMATGGK
jgi:hypothetical protein